jgi:Na+/glutamate symporter
MGAMLAHAGGTGTLGSVVSAVGGAIAANLLEDKLKKKKKDKKDKKDKHHKKDKHRKRSGGDSSSDSSDSD